MCKHHKLCFTEKSIRKYDVFTLAFFSFITRDKRYDSVAVVNAVIFLLIFKICTQSEVIALMTRAFLLLSHSYCDFSVWILLFWGAYCRHSSGHCLWKFIQDNKVSNGSVYTVRQYYSVLSKPVIMDLFCICGCSCNAHSCMCGTIH